MAPEYIDVMLITATSGLSIALLAAWESGRAKRRQRKLWRAYITLSTTPGTKYVSWENFRRQNSNV